MDKDLEWVKCNLCGSDDFTLIFKGKSYQIFTSLDFNVVKCNSCGLVCVNPRPKKIINKEVF